MKNEYTLLVILAAIQFSHIIDFMIIMPLGSQFMRVFEISPQAFSWIVAIYALSAFIFSLAAATIIDRFDRRHVLLVCYTGFTISTIACGFAPDYMFFLVARALTGAFGGILGAQVFAIIGDVFPLERRSSAMGLVMTAFSVASVVGVPVGIFLAASYSWRAPFLTIGGMAVFVLVGIFFKLPSLRSHLDNQKEKPDLLSAYANIIKDNNQLRALLFSLALILGHFTTIPFIAPYMQQNVGFSDIEVSYIYFTGGLLTVFFLPFFGKLSDRLGNVKVFTWSSILALFSIYAITNLPPVGMILALCATSSYFVVASGRNVPATTLVTAVVRPESRGSFMNVRASMNELGFFLASVISGLLVTEEADGTLGNFHLAGYVAIGMSIIAIFIGRTLKTVKEEPKEEVPELV